MNETGYILARWDTTQVAKGYTNEGPWGMILGRPMAPDGPYWVLRANGGIHSTSYDMLKWAEALLTGKALSTESMTSYWTPFVSEGEESSYGYGWSIRVMPDGEKIITHNGGNGVFVADMAIVPSKHLVAFMQTNVVGELPLASGVLDAVGARLLKGAPYPEIPEVVSVPESTPTGLQGTYSFDPRNTVETVAQGQHLLLTPHGRMAFAVVHSTRTVDLARCQDLTDRLDTIVAGFVNGNFGPLAEAYENKVTTEYLQKAWKDRLGEMVADNGTLTGFEILGTAMLRERELTVVHFTFEHGFMNRAYIWDKDAEHKMLGYSIRGLDESVMCVPTAQGKFASWDPKSGDSRPVGFEAMDNQTVLKIESADHVFEARKQE